MNCLGVGVSTYSRVEFRQSLRPAGARRLAEAERHWPPIARQRATHEDSHSGQLWPTHCNTPKLVPPAIDGSVRNVAQGERY